MKKKRAILNFAGIIFLSLILIIFSFVKFTIPGTSNEYVGFIRAIQLGLEYQGGTQVTFAVKSNNTNIDSFSNGLNSHATRIKGILSSNNYDADVYTVGGANIVVELKDEYSSEGILDLINVHSELYMRTEESTESQSYVSSSDIKNVTAIENPSYNGGKDQTPYGVYIEFTKEGQKHFKELSEKVTKPDGAEQPKSGTVYIYLGDAQVSQITLSDVVDQDYVFISGGSDMVTLESASNYAAKLNCSKYNFNFEEINSSVITKDIAKRNLILSVVIASIVIIACLVLLIVKFKQLGLVNAFSLVIALLLQIVLLQAVPVMKLTSSALVGSMLTFVLAFIVTYFMLSKTASEYALGKNLHSSIKFGYLKTFAVAIEVFCSMLVSAILFYIFGSQMVRYFALGVIIGTSIYGLFTLLINRLFTNMYHNINPSKAKKYGFKREASVHELEQI